MLAAFCLAILALRGLEQNSTPVLTPQRSEEAKSFGIVLKEIWQDGQARMGDAFSGGSSKEYVVQPKPHNQPPDTKQTQDDLLRRLQELLDQTAGSLPCANAKPTS